MPARTASGLRGAYIHPPDHAVVPPNTGSFSATITRRPACAAVTAAASHRARAHDEEIAFEAAHRARADR